ncbi:hypothetical protein CHC183_02140 [Helicobacter pylori]|nr:hypothetical protein VN0212_03560 [Helicobacter pylori]
MGIKNYEKQDFSKARKYFERACELNSGSGCNFLGFLYENGQGVEKDLIKAAYFYSRACELNSGGGYAALGDLYYDGEGVEKNLTKAAYFYSKACKLGYKKACEMLKELR